MNKKEEWFENQHFSDIKNKTISLANELILQGYELSELALNDNFIDITFRKEKLNIIIKALQGAIKNV